MTPQQLQMLSVKSAVERTVLGYIASFQGSNTQLTVPGDFYTEIERYIASLFVSRQIDNGYTIRPGYNSLEIAFVSYGQHTAITFHLPDSLTWTPPPAFQVAVTDRETVVDEPKVTTPVVVEETHIDKLNKLVPHLEEVLQDFMFSENNPMTREWVKDRMRKMIAAHATPVWYWLTCDDTNNPKEVREKNQLVVRIEIQFEKDGDTATADMVLAQQRLRDMRPHEVLLPKRKKVEKNDARVSNFMLVIFDALKDIDLSDSPEQIGHLVKALIQDRIAAKQLESYHIAFEKANGFLIGTFSVQPYADSETLTLPYTRPLK